MAKVIAVRKDDEGRITHYKLDDGSILNHDEAIKAVTAGTMEDCATFENRAGETSIRSNRGNEGFALSRLPEF